MRHLANLMSSLYQIAIMNIFFESFIDVFFVLLVDLVDYCVAYFWIDEYVLKLH